VAALLLAAGGVQAQSVFPATSLGTAVSQNVPVTAGAAGTVSVVRVLTGGASGLEFTQGGGAVTTPCAAASLSVGGACQVSVTFTPAYPGLRLGAVVLLDGSNNVLGTAYISGVGQGGLNVLTPGNIIPVAGSYGSATGAAGPGDNGPATSATLDLPASVVLDGAGNIYIADSKNEEVRMVCFSATSAPFPGIICPAAGDIVDLTPGLSLNLPSGAALDGAGNLYIADTGNQIVRKITAATGAISTVAGDGTAGYQLSDDGGPATSAELNEPQGVTVDASGNLFIADTVNNRIRRVDAVTGVITTVAGGGTGTGSLATDAILSGPYAVAFDSGGNMYIPDSGDDIVLKVDAVGGSITAASTIATIAGTGGINPVSGCPTPAAGATALTTPLNTPRGVAVDPGGNLYISDSRDGCVWRTTPHSSEILVLAETGANAVTLAGESANPLADDDVVQTAIYWPQGIFVDNTGDVYFTDLYGMVIEEIQSNVAVLDYLPTAVLKGQESANLKKSIYDDGNIASQIDTVTAGSNAFFNQAGSSCGPTLPASLADNTACTIDAQFAPSTIGNPLEGNVYVAGNTPNDDNPLAPMNIILIGDGANFTISLTSSLNPSAFGAAVSFTAKVSAGSGVATGSIAFTDTVNGTTTTLGTVALAGGQAVYTTSALIVGVHTITATYGTNSTTATVTQTVSEGTTTALSAVPASPSALGVPVVFTATISGASGAGQTLNGTVTFTDSLMTFNNNTVAVTINGVTGTATYTANALPQGVNAITAVFTPSNSTLVNSSTGTLNQDVQGAAALTIASAPNPSVYGTLVTFTVGVPAVGSAGATGNVVIKFAPVGGGAAPASLTAALSGNPAAGTATTATLPVGSYNVTATYAGDANYSSSTATLASPQVVTQEKTSTTLTATPNPGIVGGSIAIVATVTPNSGTAKPTGTVTITDTFNGATVTLANAAALANGAYTLNTAALAAGTHAIVASYPGDADDGSSSGTLSLVVAQATTVTKVTAAPSPATVQATITFTATVTGNGPMPTGTVNFLANGNIALGAGTLNATGTATVTNNTLAAGSYQITAVYNGDANDKASTSAAITEVVGLIPTDTTLSTAATTGANAQTILVSTVQNNGVVGTAPTGTVTFTSGTTTVGAAILNADGVATLTPNLTAGTYSIFAAYGGDSLHSPSQSTAVSVTSYGTSFNLVVTPATVSIPTGQNATVTVTLTSVSGFTDTIGLGCGTLPAGVNCHFSNISVPLAANGAATAQLTIDTNNPLGGGASAMNKQPGQRNFELAGLFLPFSLFLGWIVWRFRKRHAGVLSTVLILVLSGAALLATGCIGFTQNSAAAGTYTIQVVGVGQNSDVTQYQNVTLTITQ
jgi:sugar lactone lactonase YvrE